MSATLIHDDELLLAQTTARVLGMPHAICRYRKCRRIGCHMIMRATRVPFCVNKLGDNGQLLFKALEDEARHVIANAIFSVDDPRPLLCPPPPGVPDKNLRHLAIAVARTMLPASEVRYRIKKLAPGVAAADPSPTITP